MFWYRFQFRIALEVRYRSEIPPVRFRSVPTFLNYRHVIFTGLDSGEVITRYDVSRIELTSVQLHSLSLTDTQVH